MKILLTLFLVLWGTSLSALEIINEFNPSGSPFNNTPKPGYDGSVALKSSSGVYWYNSSGNLVKHLTTPSINPHYVSNELLICYTNYWDNVENELSYTLYIETPTDSNVSTIQWLSEKIVNGIFAVIDSSGKVLMYDVGESNSQSSTNFIPSNAVVIPSDASGPVQIILESSEDMVNWNSANPGTYGASTNERFFRVRAVEDTE
jgi:hypothetical protein